MTTSTVLRVKRRLEDNPQDALVLMCKKLKTDNEEASPSLFVFRETVSNEETAHIKNVVNKGDIKLKSKHSVNDIIQKIREERKDVSVGNRYEIVNLHRGLKEDVDDDFNLVDLQKTGHGDNEVQYAYDLYTAAKQDFDISMLDDLVIIENTNLIFGSFRDNGRRTPSSDEGDDDDDSNDENNWRNDYPDSEASSIDEYQMIKAMQSCDIDDDLSSDTGEDKIYNDPPDLFNEDVKRYGTAYAEYKAKVTSGTSDSLNSKNFVHCSKKDDESPGYKDVDNDGFYYGEEEDDEQFKEQYREESDSSEYSTD